MSGYNKGGDGFTSEDRAALEELKKRKDNGGFTTQDRERLVALEVQLKNLGQKFESYLETATSEVGFPRCAVRKEQIRKIEGTLTWFKRTTAGAAILAAIGVLAAGIKYIIGLQ